MITRVDGMRTYHQTGMCKETRLAHDSKVEQILNPPKKPVALVKKGTCRCKICGQLLDMLTHAHSDKHAYKDKYEMIAAGMVEFL